MSQEKQFCRNCGKRDHAFSLENTVRFWEPGLCSECHRLPIIGTHYDVFTGERIEPTPRHDGKLKDSINSDFDAIVWLVSQYTHIECVDHEVVLDAKQALSLLAWLTQEREKLEALVKEQS